MIKRFMRYVEGTAYVALYFAVTTLCMGFAVAVGRGLGKC